VHWAVVCDQVATRGVQARLPGALELSAQTMPQLYAELKRRVAELSSQDQTAARNLLLRLCEKSGDGQVLAGALLFKRLDGEHVDLQALSASAAGGIIWAVDRQNRSGHYAIGPDAIYELDNRQREFVANFLKTRVQQPPTIMANRRLLRLVGWCRRLARIVVSATVSILTRFVGAAPIERAHWSQGEATLIDSVSEELISGRFVLEGIDARSALLKVMLVRRGTVPVAVRRRGADAVVLIPRNHVKVRHMVRALKSGPANLYPVLLTLFGGHAGARYSDSCRRFFAFSPRGCDNVTMRRLREGRENL
jgi:hypothetical protein